MGLIVIGMHELALKRKVLIYKEIHFFKLSVVGSMKKQDFQPLTFIGQISHSC